MSRLLLGTTCTGVSGRISTTTAGRLVSGTLAATLHHLVTAVHGLQLHQQYGAGAYAQPPSAPIAAPGLLLQQQPQYGGGASPFAPPPGPYQGAAAYGGPLFGPIQARLASGPAPAATPLWPLPPATSAAS